MHKRKSDYCILQIDLDHQCQSSSILLLLPYSPFALAFSAKHTLRVSRAERRMAPNAEETSLVRWAPPSEVRSVELSEAPIRSSASIGVSAFAFTHSLIEGPPSPMRGT